MEKRIICVIGIERSESNFLLHIQGSAHSLGLTGEVFTREYGSIKVIAEGEEESTTNKIVETRKMALKPMSLDDAVMEMEGSKARFLIYRDSSSENVSLVYRLDDGNYALIETNS